jgi:hypothetical protein
LKGTAAAAGLLRKKQEDLDRREPSSLLERLRAPKLGAAMMQRNRGFRRGVPAGLRALSPAP